MINWLVKGEIDSFTPTKNGTGVQYKFKYVKEYANATFDGFDYAICWDMPLNAELSALDKGTKILLKGNVKNVKNVGETDPKKLWSKMLIITSYEKY